MTSGQVRIMEELVCDGPTNEQIGRRLHLAEGTIKYHLHAIYKLSGCKNRTALALWWIRKGRYEHG